MTRRIPPLFLAAFLVPTLLFGWGRKAPPGAYPEIATATAVFNEDLHRKGITIRLQDVWLGSWAGSSGTEALVLWQAVPEPPTVQIPAPWCGVDLLLAAPKGRDVHFSGRLPWAGGRNPLAFCPNEISIVVLETGGPKRFLARAVDEGGRSTRAAILEIREGALALLWEGKGEVIASDTDRDRVAELTWERPAGEVDDATFLREGEEAARAAAPAGVLVEKVLPQAGGTLRIEGSVESGNALARYVTRLRDSPRFQEVHTAGGITGGRFALTVRFSPNAGEGGLLLVWRDGGFRPVRPD